jgi:hypothetical protein
LLSQSPRPAAYYTQTCGNGPRFHPHDRLSAYRAALKRRQVRQSPIRNYKALALEWRRFKKIGSVVIVPMFGTKQAIRELIPSLAGHFIGAGAAIVEFLRN